MTRRGIFVDEYGITGRGILLVVALVVAAIVGVIVVTTVVYGHFYAADCHRLQEQSGYATKIVSSQCYMHVNERWIPADQYRMVENSK
jgi:hypothetical protein